MGKTALDEELLQGIKKARKKACHFGLISKGPQPVKLIVQKKPILAGELMKAKSEFKGDAVISGVCVGSGAELEFQVVGNEEPNIKPIKLKDYISEQTDITVKPTWKCVSDLPAVESDESGDAADAVNASSTPDVPPVSPPAPPSPEAAKLLDILSKMSAALATAVGANPARREEILALVGTVKQQIADQAFDNAKSSLKSLGSLLQQLGTIPGAAPRSGDTTNATQGTTPGDAAEQRWQKEFADLEPRYLEALKKADGPLASQLRVVFAFSTEQAEARAYDRALQGLARLAPLVEQALQGNKTGTETPTGKVAAAVLRSELQTIRTSAARGLEKLAGLLKTKPDNRAQEIQAIVAKLAQTLPTDLEDALDQLDAAVRNSDTAAAQSIRSAIQQKAQGWAAFLQTHAHEIQCCENNPWGIDVAIQQPIRASLVSILKATR